MSPPFIGHPQIITRPVNQSIGSYFGSATVGILPPGGLFHPVLPVRSGDKLTFPLSRTCVKEEQAKQMQARSHHCHHSDTDRMLRGTWCTPELVKAMEKGYTLVKIHEVWHFPEEQRRTGLCRLRQHLVKIKTGIRQVAQLVLDRGPETRVYSSLPGA